MTKKTDETQTSNELQINSVLDLQTNFKALAENHLKQRFSDSPEFKKEFIKTFSDLIFSQDEEMLEKLSKTRTNTLLNSVFKATEAGASFAKKEVYFIPYAAYKKTTEKGVEKKVATGEFDAMVIFDVNFQKQTILKLENCKRFFTAEVHEGVKIIEDLTTGNKTFEGENDVTKPTVGYYACFITTEGERYDNFMTLSEIIDRAKFSPQFKAENYKQVNNNIHFEKVVVRNLLKEIPKISTQLKSILEVEDAHYSDYIEVNEPMQKIEAEKPNRLEEAKKEIVEKEKPKAKEIVDKETGEVSEVEDEIF